MAIYLFQYLDYDTVTTDATTSALLSKSMLQVGYAPGSPPPIVRP